MMTFNRFYLILSALLMTLLSFYYFFTKVENSYVGVLVVKYPLIYDFNKSNLDFDIEKIININSKNIKFNEDKIKFKVYENENDNFRFLKIKLIDNDFINLKKNLVDISTLFHVDKNLKSYLNLNKTNSEINKYINEIILKSFKRTDEFYDNLKKLNYKQDFLNNKKINQPDADELVKIITEAKTNLENIKKYLLDIENFLLNFEENKIKVNVSGFKIEKSKTFDFLGHLFLIIFTVFLTISLLYILDKNKRND